MNTPLFDAHIHIKTGTSIPEELLNQLSLHGGNLLLNSVSPENSNTVSSSFNASDTDSIKSDTIHKFFGIHPWYVKSNFDIKVLKKYLQANPDAGIGECGLDFSPKFKLDMDTQLEIFKAQLDLGIELRRPVSIHSVKSWDSIFKLIGEAANNTKIRFMIHSFYGSAEVMHRITKLGGFISLSPASLKNPNKSYSVIRQIPVEKLLIESDMTMNSDEFSTIQYLQQLKNIYNTVSEIRNVSIEELTERVIDNGKVFTHRETPWT